MALIYDVTVVGLGGHGAAATAHLSERGSRILGIDKFQRAHGNGSSHGRSRIIRLAYYEDHRYVPMLRRSLALWHVLNDRLFLNPLRGDPKKALLKITGGLMIGLPDSEVILGTIASIKKENLSHEILDSQEIRSRYPAFQVSDQEIGIYESDAGYLVPEECINAHLDVAEENGANLRFNETVVSWIRLPLNLDADDDSRDDKKTDLKDNIYQITTSHGENGQFTSTYLTRKIVLAVGPWAPELYGADIPLQLHAERRIQYWFQPRNADFFKDIPIYIWDTEHDGSFYGFPVQEGSPDCVKVAMHFVKSELDNGENICTPDSISRVVTDKEVNEMRSVLQSRIPILNGELVASATCMYTLTPDHHFLIDFHPSHGNDVLLLSPCSGHGFKFCSVMGEIVADLMREGATQHDISLFSFEARKGN